MMPHSLKLMRISFVHYTFKDDGVTRVVLNNIKGIREVEPSYECNLVSSIFSENISDSIQKKKIDWDSEDHASMLHDAVRGSDAVVIENPTLGKYPGLTRSFKKLAESSGMKVIYRIHDLVDDRPEYYDAFYELFPALGSEYPRSDNVSFLALTNNDKARLENKGLDDVHVLANPVIPEELMPRESDDLRERLVEDDVIGQDETMLTYPVRVLPRKNIEEALFMSSLIEGGRLVVSLGHERGYQGMLERFAEDFNIPYSFGEASRYITDEKFSIGDLLGASDYVMTTSIREGFGFAFIEPWMADTPVMGRDIPQVTEDFKQNGVLLDHLYDDWFSEDTSERIDYYRKRMSDQGFRQKKRRSLERMMEEAEDSICTNKEAVTQKYDYREIAKELLSYIQ